MEGWVENKHRGFNIAHRSENSVLSLQNNRESTNTNLQDYEEKNTNNTETKENCKEYVVKSHTKNIVNVRHNRTNPKFIRATVIW